MASNVQSISNRIPLINLCERLPHDCGLHASDTLVLDHLQREKGRFRAHSAAGQDVGVFVDRGHPLLIGELLRADCGRIFRIEGALEPVATASTDDWQLFSRACYHLGNRHIKLQIGARWLRITPDHVLEDMLVQLGLEVQRTESVFEPERGAYGHHHH